MLERSTADWTRFRIPVLLLQDLTQVSVPRLSGPAVIPSSLCVEIKVSFSDRPSTIDRWFIFHFLTFVRKFPPLRDILT